MAPNHDTVYVLAILDLRDGPYVLTLPAIPDRYHVFQFLDAWMGDFALVGMRTTGGRAGSWVIVPPGLRRATFPTAPIGSTARPTRRCMLGRIRAVDDADARAASAIGDQIHLEPPIAAPAPHTADHAAAAGTPQTVGPRHRVLPRAR